MSKMAPSEPNQFVHIQSQICDRGKHSPESRGEEILAVRILCAQVGQSERGKPGDSSGPASKTRVNRTGAFKRRLHFLCLLECLGSADDFMISRSFNGSYQSNDANHVRWSELHANPETNRSNSENLRKHFLINRIQITDWKSPGGSAWGNTFTWSC